MAPPADLRAWIALLEREGELVRVRAEVDADLEITEINDRFGIVHALALSAWLAVGRGRVALAGSLWGAVDAEAGRGRIGGWEEERADYLARIVSDDPEFERGYAEGRTKTLDDAVETAFANLD